MITRKLYIDKIRTMIGMYGVKIITGQRRVGKSTLLQYLAQQYTHKQVLIIDFELKQFDKLRQEDELYAYIKQHQTLELLAIDEIQECRGWERVLLSLLKEYPLMEIWVTGSNSSILASDLTTNIRGRYIELHILPFSYQEYLLYHAQLPGQESFLGYLQVGGFAGLYSSIQSSDIRQERSLGLIDTIFIRDIVERYTIKHITMLRELFAYIVNTSGNVFSFDKFQRFLESKYRTETSYLTTQQYLQYLTQVYMIYPVDIFDIEGKHIIQRQKKRYISDHSRRKVLFSQYDPGMGKELENIVYLEAIRHGRKVYVGRLGNKEVDFILEYGKERVYIQVCYILSNTDVIQREFGVLEDIDDNFPKYVISLDSVVYHHPKNILHKRFWEMDEVFERRTMK